MSKFTEIKKTFEDTILTSTWWSRHVGSQFIDYLVLFVSKIVERVEGVAARALQESFLSLATKRTSILAAAETEGYVGRKASPSVGFVTVTNIGEDRITLPTMAQAVASNQIRYTIIGTVDLDAGQQVDVEVQQLEVSTISYTVGEAKSWLSILFPRTMTNRIHRIIVRVNGEEWEHSFKFRDTDNESKAYMEYYRSTDQYGVRFGNGFNGMIPQVGDIITFELWLTDGVTSLLDGQPITLIDTDTFSGSRVTADIKTKTPIIGGDQPEDIESIRNGALYAPIYDEQVAWDSDYITFIKRNISGINWLSIWGEEGQEGLTGVYDIRNINRIFICVHSPSKPIETVHAEITDLFSKREGYNEHYVLVQRKRLPFTIYVSGKVDTSKDPAFSAKALGDMLETTFGEDATITEAIQKNQIWHAIENMRLELGIDSFELTTNGMITDDVPIDTHHFMDVANSEITLEFQN